MNLKLSTIKVIISTIISFFATWTILSIIPSYRHGDYIVNYFNYSDLNINIMLTFVFVFIIISALVYFIWSLI